MRNSRNNLSVKDVYFQFPVLRQQAELLVIFAVKVVSKHKHKAVRFYDCRITDPPSMSALWPHSQSDNFDLLRIKSKYGLRCSTEEEENSEAEMSIAYQRMRNSFEEEGPSQSGMKSRKMRDILVKKDRFNILGKIQSHCQRDEHQTNLLQMTRERCQPLAIR